MSARPTKKKPRTNSQTIVHTQTLRDTLTPSILFGLNIWPWKLLPNTPLSICITIVCIGAIVIVAETTEVIAVLILNG